MSIYNQHQNIIAFFILAHKTRKKDKYEENNVESFKQYITLWSCQNMFQTLEN